MTRARRVIITGPIGAGKSTLAAELARAWDLPHIEIDPIYITTEGWLPGNREALRAALESRFAENPDGWIFDGSQDRAIDLVYEQADMLIWLHFGAWAVFPRLLRRSIRHRARKEVLWGIREVRWSDMVTRRSPLLWCAALWRTNQREARARIRRMPPGTRVVILRNPRQVRAFLAKAQAPA